mgnify:CR=1 FL=1
MFGKRVDVLTTMGWPEIDVLSRLACKNSVCFIIVKFFAKQGNKEN